ncbi:hypothetical protein N0Y54_15805 [Nostoc punctiforme UO1]|uniref:hypothetical protein n=1 Tax=Nostoc punctiforme TaxID=272131 RepID=UPI0030A011E9
MLSITIDIYLPRTKVFPQGTKDAHGLYHRYGFKNLSEPEKIMMRLNPNANRV